MGDSVSKNLISKSTGKLKIMSQRNQLRGKFYFPEKEAIRYPQINEEDSVARICPHCLSDVKTVPIYRVGYHQGMLSQLACLFGFCCCLCCICLQKDEWNDVYHYCPSCKQIIGVHMHEFGQQDKPKARRDKTEEGRNCVTKYFECF